LRKDSNICVSVRNPLSDYEVRDKVAFSLQETVEQEENTREPPCHFTIKWEGSHKRSTLEVLEDAKAALKKKKYKGEQPRDYKSDDSGKWVPILAVECRGMEPYAFHPLGNEFVVESEGGVKFESDIDLSEGDWADYDEENDAAISISDFEAKFESV
jgi:Eukaryotic protein of unknown function (DUF866)